MSLVVPERMSANMAAFPAPSAFIAGGFAGGPALPGFLAGGGGGPFPFPFPLPFPFSPFALGAGGDGDGFAGFGFATSLGAGTAEIGGAGSAGAGAVLVVLEPVVLEPAEAWPWKRAWPHLLEPHPKQVDLLHWCHLQSI